MSLSWLVVGIGDISRKRVIPAILAEPRSSLAGLVTRDPAKAAPYGVPGWSTLAAALDATDAQVVYIATPVFLHAPQSIAAMRAGRHVLCEKPMGLNYSDATRLVRTAEETGRLLGVAYYRRMYPKVERARQLIASGAIGKPFLAEATCHEWRPAGQADDWRSDPYLAGGGPLFDIASHRIDLMNYLFDTPARATGFRSNLVEALPVEDNATVMVEYAGGVRGIVDVRWHSKIRRDEFRIRGTEGELNLTPLNGPELAGPGGAESIPPHANLHYPLIAEFADSVLDGAPLRSSGATALYTDWITQEIADGKH